MADSKITALTAISTVDPTADPLVIVDVSDTSMAASGTTKKSTINQLLGSGGTATLASATITGDLTVDTSTLKVDSTNNVVGIQNATPEADALVNSALVIGNGTAARGIMLYGTTSSQQNIAFSDTAASQQGLLQYDHSVDQMKFFTSGTLQATLNSTGLGVGVSPTNNLTVQTSSAKGGIHINYSGSTIGLLGIVNPGVSNNTIIGSVSNNSLELMTNNSTKATIDSSGNVGIGVTPSGYRLHVRAAFASTVGGAFIESSEFNQKGLLVNCTSASLSANIVEFQREGTARMTLDSAGNLILQSSATPATLATNGQLTVNATSNTNLRFSYRGSDGTTRVANITLA